MKRLLTFLALCCLMVTGAWADGFQASTVETPVVYNLTSSNGLSITKDLTLYGGAGSGGAVRGKFAFISQGESAYKIYETISGKYVALTTTATNNCKNGTRLVDSEGDAEIFTISVSETENQYLICPTNVTGAFMQFNGNKGQNQEGQTVGFWTGGNEDASSKWKFETPAATIDAPFAYADSYENITKWYFVKLHSGANHWLYAADEGSIAFNNPYQDTDNYLWGFVWKDGCDLQVYNKATRVAIDNSNPCKLTEAGAYFELCPTTETSSGGFCLRVAGETNYLNYQSGIKRWGNNNNGSTFVAEEFYADPVKFVSSIEDIDNATWYQLTVKGQYIKYDEDGTYHDGLGDKPALDDEASWFAFVGNRADGFKIVNKAAGTDKAMGADNVNNDTRTKAMSLADAHTYGFRIMKVDDQIGWQIYDKADNGAAFLNNQSINLGYWRSNGDTGNRFTFVEVPAIHFYTVTVIGAPNGQTPEVSYKGTPVIDNRFGAETDLVEGDITATDYTDYTKTITFDNSARTVTVAYTRDIKQITDLANLSNDKAYVLICGRGQLSTSDGQLASVAENETAYTAEANKFAIIKSGDKYYLWSVAEDGYVHTTKYTNTVYAAQEITLTHQSDNTFLLKIAGKGMNMQDKASGIIIDGWVAADGGNKYAIYEVDDFADAEKAIAAIPGKIQVGKVYTIKAHFTGEDYTDHYLSSDASTEQLTLTDEDSATQSYWVAEASGNTDRPWKFKSGYGYAKYLDWQNGGLTANGDNFKLIGYVNAGTPVSFDYNLNVSTDNRNIGAWADASKGFGAVGQGLCWAGNAGHNNSDWTTDYIIEEVTGVDVYTVSGNATAGITGITDYTYASSIGAGSVVIVPTGTELTSANFTTAPDVAVIINSEAHTITVRTKSCPDEGTWYVTIENHEKGRKPYLFNDIEYADDYTEQGSSVAGNGYTWKVTSDGSGNLTSVKNAENGEGIKINGGTDYISSFPYEAVSEDEGYYYLGVSGSYLNAANGNYVDGHRVVTTYGKENASKWRFNVVDTEDLVEYNVVVNPAESRGYAVYGGKKAGNGGFLLAPEGLTQSDFAGGEPRAYFLGDVTLENHTITVNYTAATPVEVTYKLYLNDPIVDEHGQVTGYNEKHLADATATVTEYIGKAPSAVPFDCPEYVTFTYPELVDGVFAAENTEVKVVSEYNDLMPFTPGALTTVDIDVRNHFYFHVEKREITFFENNEEKVETIWMPCISPKAPTFGDDAAYIWKMEGDWYNGFRFHNDQIAKESAGEGDGTNCHIAFHHQEERIEPAVQEYKRYFRNEDGTPKEGCPAIDDMTDQQKELYLQRKYRLVKNDSYDNANSRATLTGDVNDASSYFDLVYAEPGARQSEASKFQFKIHGTNHYLNFRDEHAYANENPDSLLCLFGGGYGDQASSYTFHKGEVCTEDDRRAVLAMIDAIDKGAVGAILDDRNNHCQEYNDLITLADRIANPTIGCTRALFDIYTEKLVNAKKSRKVATGGEAYRLAVRTKKGRNLYLTDEGTYTTDSLKAAIYVLGTKGENQILLAGNNNESLHYFTTEGCTEGSYTDDVCAFNHELMNNVEVDGTNIDATGAAMYATVKLNTSDGKVVTMNTTSDDEAAGKWEDVEDIDVAWQENGTDAAYMNDDLSSAIVMEPVPYPYNKPKFAKGTPDEHAGGYASIWLPYPMKFADGVEVYKGTNVENEKLLVLTQVNTDEVVAAGGYILCNPGQSEETLTQLVLPAAADPESKIEDADNNVFYGSTENPLEVKEDGSWAAFREQHPNGTPYVLAKKNGIVGYYKYKETETYLPKGKAIWFSNYNADSSAECVQFTFREVISAIEALHGNTDNAEIYDLQGHRLNKVEKGQVNVINGKKVMFK